MPVIVGQYTCLEITIMKKLIIIWYSIDVYVDKYYIFRRNLEALRVEWRNSTPPCHDTRAKKIKIIF